MSYGIAALTVIFCVSYGPNVLDYLAADGAGLTVGQATVVAVGQVNAHFGSGLHFEVVHCLTSLRNIDLVVALSNDLSAFAFFGRKHFLKNAFPVPWYYFAPKTNDYTCLFAENDAKYGYRAAVEGLGGYLPGKTADTVKEWMEMHGAMLIAKLGVFAISVTSRIIYILYTK